MTKTTQFMFYFNSFAICFAFFALGLSVSVEGPTLPNLVANINETLYSTSYLFPFRGIGGMLGSFVSGYLFEKFDKPFILFVSLIIIVIGNTCVPFAKTGGTLTVIFFFLGLSVSVVDTGGNVFILELWKDKSSPWMQLIHFMFAFGASIAPLVSAPFITANNSTNSINNITQVSRDDSFPNVAWPYIICAIFTTVISGIFLLITLLPKKYKINSGDSITEDANDTLDLEGFNYRLKMLSLLFLFVVVYVGLEIIFGTYIYTFLITCENPMSEIEASLINTLFWAFLAFGRLISIFISLKMSTKRMLAIDLVITLLMTVAFLCYPYYAFSAQGLIWFFVAVFGLGLSNIFPTTLSWADLYITMNSRAASILLIGGGIGEMAIPALVSLLIEDNPMSLMYIVASCTFFMLVTAFLLHKISSKKGKRQFLKRESALLEVVPLSINS